MSFTCRKSLILASSALCVAAAMPAMAQEAAEGVGDVDIIVTARRVEEKLQDVPISITVFNQDAISKRNIVNTADLGTYTPSLSTNSKYGPEKASFVIRGFVQDLATQPSVGVYFADVVAPRSGGSTTSGNGVGVGALFDLQNVQVLKGPQGTLFGRNTTGGAVLLVPQKPTDTLEGYVEGGLGNYDMKRVQVVLNLPLADTFKVRLGVDRMKRDGYLKNHTSIGPSRLADTDFIAARLSIVADLTPDLENYTVVSFADSDNHGITARVVGCNRTLAAQYPTNVRALNAYNGCIQVDRQAARGDGWWDVENTEPSPKLHMTTWQAVNTTTWLASDTLTVKNIASYGEFHETTRMSLEGEAFLNPNGTPQYTLIRLRNTQGHNNAAQSTWTEELQFQGRTTDGRLNWQAGGYYEASDPLGFTSQWTPFSLSCADDYALQCVGAAPTVLPVNPSNPSAGVNTIYSSNISIPFQKTWFRSKGLYAQATYRFTDQLAMTGGFRYTWDSMRHRYDGTAIAFLPDNSPVFYCNNTVRVKNANGTAPVYLASVYDHSPCNVTYSAKSNKPTWMVDLEYKPVQDVMVYAKWARGYRAGGAATANIFFETWGPEKVDTYEIGAKTSFRTPAVRGYFNLTGFYNDFRNQQIQATLVRATLSPLLGGSAIVNAGKSRIWGIEVDTAVTLFNDFRIDAGYAYLNTKLQEATPIVVTPEIATVWSQVRLTADVGGPLGLSPKNRFSVTGTYTLPLDSSIGKISFGATFVHTDKQTASLATLPQFGIMPSTNLLNLNASWDNVLGKPVDISFFMTNATKEKFPLNVNNAYTSFGLESQIVNEPRMWGFRMKYRFGN